MLRRIDAMGHDQFQAVLRSVCGEPPSAVTGRVAGRDFDGLWRRRAAHLGNAGVVSYDRPIQALRAEGVWLYDGQGKVYLDAYNNVPHVGHCHPRVVSAVARQTATLNTNTRYLYAALPDYAERLTATLPKGLDVCYFVSSGSEANDLAWRLAKNWTGNSGGLIMDNAYHGITDAVYKLSPSARLNSTPLSAHIAVLEAPDDYRGPWKRDIPDRGRRYAKHCEDALMRLRQHGHDPAALFIDTILSSSGIFVPPPGYLEEVFRCVHAAGGLCVADEVQSGFGRLGNWMWGFESGGVVPDIVTFGKPIAGGYPMGLVVTSRAITECFEQHTEFFSTTGGNPVACAAALAVLDVIETEDLINNALHVGNHLISGIRKLSRRHDLIGDVRGSGLFIGVELVRDRETLEAAPDETRIVVNALRGQGVLVGIDGPLHNVIKIRPPMVFNAEHANHLLRCLDSVFAKFGEDNSGNFPEKNS
jgi:4-aminobutyrate aminotransferase-like enzyme